MGSHVEDSEMFSVDFLDYAKDYRSFLRDREACQAVRCRRQLRLGSPMDEELYTAPSHVYFNAGLPSVMGSYGEDPEVLLRYTWDDARDGLINSLGGCAGTLPPHINAVVKGVAPLKLVDKPKYPVR